MPIITSTKGGSTIGQELLIQFPNQFASQNEKESDSWIKTTVDYFYNVAVQQFQANKRKDIPNYELVKGILKSYHFNDTTIPEADSFVQETIRSSRLPDHVKHYSIITAPLNEMTGEASRRPDNSFLKDFSDDATSKEKEFRQNLINQYFTQQIQEGLAEKLKAQGIEGDEFDQQLDKLTADELQKRLSSYNSEAEQWGNIMLEMLKVNFSMKEKSEEGFRDLFTVAKEAYHIYEDNSPMGFNIECLNPPNVWKLSTPNEKYISDPLDRSAGAYAAGTIEIMELSEILHKFQLTKKEIDHLHELASYADMLPGEPSSLVNPNHPTGAAGITYHTYDPAIMRARLFEQESLNDNPELEDMDRFLGVTSSIAAFGSKFIVLTGYFCSKKKIGEVSYIDQMGQPQTMLVDENYKEGSHPQEVSVEWSYTNQWMKFRRIGPDVYMCEPFELLPYCPIFGVIHEGKNTRPASYIDMMKSFQALYNIWINKAFESTQKDKGRQILMNKRHIPLLKDGLAEDSIEIFEAEMENNAMIYIDDSTENAKGPSTFNQYTVLDASRIQEIRGYFELAQLVKQECWELLGFSKQRLGSVQATETATATNAALSQSYAQTENLFSTHEYVMNKVYQALLDAALYVESNKSQSTLKYVSSEGQQAFVAVNGADLKLADLKLFMTSRGADLKILNNLRQLSQAMMQNGASLYEVAVLNSTNSIAKIKDIFKDLKEKQEAMQQQEMQQKQQQLDQQQQQFQAQQEEAMRQHEADQQFEAWQKELDRVSKERIALIAAQAKVSIPASSPEGQDLLDTAKHNLEVDKASKAYEIQVRQLDMKQQEIEAKMAQAREEQIHNRQKLAVEQQRIAADERIAKSKPKPAKK